MTRAAADTIESPAAAVVAPTPRSEPVLLYYVIEGLTTHGVALMLSSIYFYTTQRFGWGSTQNFMLAAALGVIYVLCALSAHPIATRLGRRETLVLSYLVMSACAAVALWLPSPAVLVGVLLVYSGVSAINWPALESLVATTAEPGRLGRTLGIYNCVWSGAGTLTFAGAGLVLEHWPAGIFVLPAVVHAATATLTWAGSMRNAAAAEAESDDVASAAPAEPELLRVRTLALWMSRLALPATFVVISSLLAAMPTLPLILRLDPAARTVVASVWMGARWGTFLLLAVTVWWHARPLALLWAAFLLLAAFVAITFRPEWLPGRPSVPTGPWVAWMIVWQLALGVALGLIYSASLYFGMVLSEGSTEHGGYHEALIGLGTVIGPGAGALAQGLGGGSPARGVAAVAAVIAATALACVVVALRRTDRSTSTR